ncbi:hydrogenase iron-sulfur subunit [Halosegnis sp.]|uniref:hydrogenase iron-sulfur subunit n=1 Tax=Halosegnis sp. TaxID=2864959 RepID=UPI0035D41B1E
MNVGAFVCSCGDTCDIDLKAVREGVDEVDVVASSELLCQDGRPAMSQVIEEYDLDQLIATTPEPSCQERIRALADDHGLHPEATAFVDHRESTAWVHDAEEATEKTARLINAKQAGLAEEAVSRTVSTEAGERVAVVGDPEAARSLSDEADVTLFADGREFADEEELGDVRVERGHAAAVEGRFGEFELVVRAQVTEDCIDCLECVREGPDGMVTEFPVDIHPEAPDGDWVDVCPTDAIDLDGTTRRYEFDQVVHPGGTARSRGGRVGYYTGPVDAGTIAAVEAHLGGIEKPKFLDLEMDVCAAGESSQQGCTACVDACPHEAVDRPAIDEVAFDETACQNCGACTSACPTGATRLREPSNERIAREVETLVEREESGGLLGDSSGIDEQVVAFVCSERAKERLRAHGRRARRQEDLSYPPVLPVEVNCTDTVGEAHVMHALAAGADGVAIVGCGGACLHSGPDPKAELIERLNTATTDLGLGERVGFFAPEAGEPAAFAAELSAFVDGLGETPIPAGEHEASGRIDTDRPNPDFDSHGWTLESVRALLEHVEPDREVIRGLKDFGLLSVNDSCTLTPTCTNLCPTDAIRRTDDGQLQFNHERCVNCELCEEGCPETAITMETGLDLSLLPERNDGEAWTTVHEDEMLECVRCGKPFTSAASAAKVEAEVGDRVDGLAPDSSHSVFEYCGDCRGRLLFDQGDKR